MKKSELRVAVQEMDTYQFGLKNELHNKLSKVTSYVSKKEVIDLINQLEEPKQEKLVIPQFVADWMNKRKQNFKTSHDAILYIHSYGWDDETHIDFKLYKWIPDNVETFARAWLDGYTVEKENLYRVKVDQGPNYLYVESLHLYSDVIKPLDFNYKFSAKEHALKFASRNQAKGVAEVVDGEVEEVTD